MDRVMIEAIKDFDYVLYNKIRHIAKGTKYGCIPTDDGIKILDGMYWVSPYDICDFTKCFKIATM